MLRVVASSLVCLSLLAGCATTSGSRSPSLAPTATPGPTGASTAPSSNPTPTPSPAASPTSSRDTSSSGSFSVLPAQEPPNFVSQITCSGSIGASDPVAIVQLHEAEPFTGDVVLLDYADRSEPRTVCTFSGDQDRIAQLIDARHVVVRAPSYKDPNVYAVVDLPEVRYHWFQLPVTPGSGFITLSPGLDQVVWEAVDPQGSGTDTVHITTSAGDQVVATLPDTNEGRCGDPDDSRPGAYTHAGAHLYVLNQPYPGMESLLVVEGETVVLSVLPPTGYWPAGADPAMAVWSPISEALFYRQDDDVWQWTPAGGRQLYLPGVRWSFPTFTPDGAHLAYAVVRPDGLHDVYLVDLTHDGSPKRIGKGARNKPVFLNSTQLWYTSEDVEGCVGPDAEGAYLVDNLTDGSESPSFIDRVLRVWPTTSSTF
jgi:hypothetical protein